MRGRPPVPTGLKLLRGNPGHRPINKSEPKPRSRDVKPPKFLNAHALEEWRRVIEELRVLGLVTSLDRAALAAYCQAYGTWADAEEKLSEARESDTEFRGLLARSERGALMVNPLVRVARDASAAMMRYAIEFGMTPSARSRIDASPPEEEGPAEEYFN